MANVPTLQTATTAPTQIQVGPGALYNNVTKPADGAVLQVSGYASGAQDQRVYGPALFTVSGTFVGSTIGESGISYKPQFVDIKIETATATVEKVLDQEESSCSFSVAQLTTENFQSVLPGSYWGQPLMTTSTSNDPLTGWNGSVTQVMHVGRVGGLRLVDPMCIAFISANRRIGLPQGPFSYVYCGYNAVSTEGFDAQFARGSVTMTKVRYEMLSDQTRSIGDQLFQFVTRMAS